MMNGLVQALCFFCAAVGSPPYPQLPQQAGDIWYRHEMLSRGSHLLRLSTTDFILDSDRYREERLYAYAHHFASQRCGGRFNLVPAERRSWTVHPVYAKQYIIHCR